MDEYELLTTYALTSTNYKRWRKEHTKIFGEIFSSAFADNVEAKIHLTAALINISKREFEAAIPKLSILERICINDYDCAVVNYFTGLTYEMLKNESKMNKYYENLKASNVSFVFPLPFHPYYRTAKFAQRDSECGKGVFYYEKALSLYTDIALDKKQMSSISQIIYDIATIYLYMHRYDECEKYLDLSHKYDESENQHRIYVTSILYAVQGKIAHSRSLLDKMSSFLCENCKPMVEAILAQTDPHYCVVTQDRSNFTDFWNELISQKSNIETLIRDKKTIDAQEIISEKLSKALAFMKKRLACRVEMSSGKVTVFCKNYYVKSLVAEHSALFSAKPSELNNWSFVSVNEFEIY